MEDINIWPMIVFAIIGLIGTIGGVLWLAVFLINHMRIV